MLEEYVEDLAMFGTAFLAVWPTRGLLKPVRVLVGSDKGCTLIVATC